MCRQKSLYFIVFTVISVLCANFFARFLTDWWIVCLLGVALGVSFLLFGFKKENSWRRSDVCAKIGIWAAVSLLVQYSIGMSIGFLQVADPLTDVVYIILLVVISEFLRYILCFKSNSIHQMLLIGLMFVLVDIVLPLVYADKNNLDDLVEFSVIHVLPSLSKNVLLIYMSKKVGYSPCILYRVIMETYAIFIRIIPDFGEYIDALVAIVFPLILFYNLYKTTEPKRKGYTHTLPQNNGNKIWTVATIALFLVVVYFTSGVFRFHALTIVSGSMEPNIHIGDMIIVDKYYKDHVDEINLGDVLVFNKSGVAVSHRVIEIKNQDNELRFYTKGDNNDFVDSGAVEPEDVIGVTKITVPFVGYPVLIWNKVINKG